MQMLQSEKRDAKRRSRRALAAAAAAEAACGRTRRRLQLQRQRAAAPGVGSRSRRTRRAQEQPRERGALPADVWRCVPRDALARQGRTLECSGSALVPMPMALHMLHGH
jgi:hypothetical protein